MIQVDRGLKTVPRQTHIDDAFKSLTSYEIAEDIRATSLSNCGLELDDVVIITYLSKYSTKSAAEFIAEAYSSNADNKLTNEVKKILKKKWGI
ncbi:MAG: hypothetical protein Q4C49_10745 [Bacillota bacterium]|nr:hypothetical protein [Bacillota bacterium]